MKVQRFFPLLLAAALPALAQADDSGKASAHDPASLGAFQSVIDFCSHADPANDRNYDRQADLVASDDKKLIAEARKTALYKNAYATLTSILSGIPHTEAVQLCGSIPAPTKPKRPDRDDHRE